MKTNKYLRARIRVFEEYADRSKAIAAGFWDLTQNSEEDAIKYFLTRGGNELEPSDHPLSMTELMMYSTWYRLHPEKVAGVESASTSLFFPVKVTGTMADVVATVRAGIGKQPAAAGGKSAKAKLLLLKAKAKVKIKIAIAIK